MNLHVILARAVLISIYANFIVCAAEASTEACSFLLRDRKGMVPYGRGGGEDLGGVMGRGICNQDTLCKKRMFSIKAKVCCWLSEI